MEFVTITSDYKITFPESIVKSLNLKPGDEFFIDGKEDSIVLMRKKPISDFKGKFKRITEENLRDEFDRTV